MSFFDLAKRPSEFMAGSALLLVRVETCKVPGRLSLSEISSIVECVDCEKAVGRLREMQESK